MGTTFKLNQSSINHSPFLNNHQINAHNFKSNPQFSSIKFSSNPNFKQINCNLSKPLITPSIHSFGSIDGCRNTLDVAVRGDFRVWSKRRPGSGSGGKKNRVCIALECTKCLGNRYTTEKRRVARVDKKKKMKENKNVKLGDALMLNKYCPKCRAHFLHKEVKIGTSK